MILKRIVIGALSVVAVLVTIGLVLIGIMILPGQPRSGAGLKFLGFVPLPNTSPAALLNVLDYLTVDGRRLYVPNATAGVVYGVPLGGSNLLDGSAIREGPAAGAAHGVTIDPVSKLLFVSRSGANVVDVTDPVSLALLRHIPVADDVDLILYDPADKLIYAAHGDPHLATLIDPARQSKVGTIALGGQPEFAVYDPRTRRIFQNLTDTSTLAVVDVAKRAVVERWPLAPCQAPTSAALDATNRRLFVVCAKNARLVVMNLDDHRILTSIPIGRVPDSVVYDPVLKRIYSTGLAGDLATVQQDSPDRYRSLGMIHLHYGAHTLALDPVTHRIYVAYASLLGPPRLAVLAPAK